jgi:outer membrane beta-barrel protein
MLAKRIFIIFLLLDLSCVFSKAADEDPDIDAIEAEFTKKKEEQKAEVGSGKKSKSGKDVSSQDSKEIPDLGETKASDTKDFDQETEAETEKIKFSDLSHFAPFSEVSVIQKKFLPKTTRFQFHLGSSYLTNNPFYDTLALSTKLAFYFSDSIGLEINGMFMNRAPKYVTEDLKDIHAVLTNSLVSAKSYVGLDLVLVPFYGKITWLDNRIIPYDFYLSLGGGSTTLTDVKDSASTLHVAVGQIYALTKSFVVRWDLSVNSYKAEVPEVTNTGSATNTVKSQDFRDVFLGGGISFFFPGADYR